MPWYRLRWDHFARVREQAEAARPRTALDRALLELSDRYTCQPVMAGTLIHVHYGYRGNQTAPRPCAVCGWISERLCDWKLSGGRDCDRPLCAACATSPAPDKDLCPQHARLYKAWCAGRTNSVDGAGP